MRARTRPAQNNIEFADLENRNEEEPAAVAPRCVVLTTGLCAVTHMTDDHDDTHDELQHVAVQSALPECGLSVCRGDSNDSALPDATSDAAFCMSSDMLPLLLGAAISPSASTSSGTLPSASLSSGVYDPVSGGEGVRSHDDDNFHLDQLDGLSCY